MSFKPLNEYPQHPMDPGQGEVMMGLVFSELQAGATGQVDESLQKVVDADFLAKIITKRLEVFGGAMTPQCMAFITFIAKGNPGTGLMYAHAVHMRTPVGSVSNLETFAHTFTTGFPNEDDFSKAWDGQKVAGMNMIDTPEGWARK